MADPSRRRGQLAGWLWPFGILPLLALSVLFPTGDAVHWRTLVLGSLIAAGTGTAILAARTGTVRTAARDIGGILLLLLTILELVTGHTAWLPAILVPPPESILAILQTDAGELLTAAGRSLVLFACGYGLALALAIPIGLLLGWRTRPFRAAQPVIKVLSPLPPIVYAPYAIALLPTFRTAAVTVVFIGAFWPLLARTMQGVRLIPQHHLDAAHTLELRGFALLRRVILPGAMPAICDGATLALVFAFMLMTSAELIGASGGVSSGLGFYVMYADEILDHRRVLGGILFLGLIVSAIVALGNSIERRLLRWRE